MTTSIRSVNLHSLYYHLIVAKRRCLSLNHYVRQIIVPLTNSSDPYHTSLFYNSIALLKFFLW
ncbi:999_t:CDS:2 [Funneliformis mosseae]|uniref:999_t:CDS:1 n=1 Tax=Funneliformis mosseae TaxID=27381 RepID=A0A9N9G735_FUNMO|nr:999_t:CDS:2 [Funneliformis mosseae]